MNIRLSFAFVASLSSVTTIWGQSAAPLRGVVVDPQGKPVASARLSLFNSGNSSRTSQIQTLNGDFEFPAISRGRYLIEASAEGFRQTTLAVDFNPAANAKVEVRLSIRAVQHSVLVTAEAGAQSMDEVAKAVSVLDRAEIDARNEYSLSETLRNTPGLLIRNLGGPGQSTSVRARGLRADATAILIDGMRFRDVATTQGDASSFLSSLNIINPERVEVLRGSGSTLYGSNAVGGVVNVVTEQGGSPAHGDLLMEGGSLGLLRGKASFGGGVAANRLVYSGGLLHLNVLSGVDGDDRARSTGAQLFTRYQIRRDFFASLRFLGSDDFVQPNASPTASGLPAANIPNTIIVQAIALPEAEVLKTLAKLPFQAGNATFIPSRDDPDNRRASRFNSTAFKLQQAVNGQLNWQLSYQRTSTRRLFENGPAGIGFQPVTSNLSRFNGGINTVDAKLSYRVKAWNTISAGYEFEQEDYRDTEDDRVPGPARVATDTRARQRSHALYLQNQLSLLQQKLQISFSGRTQIFSLDKPEFVTAGTANNYEKLSLAAPPRALTGDVAISYFVAKTGTKLRTHGGNSYRAPSLYERFGSGFFFNPTTAVVAFTPYGDPRLSPDRYNSVDGGIDQYFAANKVRVSATYFYTRIARITQFDSASVAVNVKTDPFGRTSGYFNGAGGISRGAELSAEARPFRATLLNASYTYTNANTDQDVSVRGFFKAFTIVPHMATFMVNQQMGKKTSVTVDLYRASSYYNALSAAGRARAYQYPGLTKLDVVLSHVLWSTEAQSLRLYGKLDNVLNREYYENGFRSPKLTGLVGLKMNFR